LAVFGGDLNAPRLRFALALLLGGIVLVGAAWLRGAEYDEQYTVFLLAGDPRPDWPASAFTVADVRSHFHGTSSPLRIAADLRRGDVHPPLYFWAVAGWSHFVGDTLFRLRLFSVLCALGALAAVGLIARRIGVPAALAMLLTLGCYAFAYTGGTARGFALAQLLAALGVLTALHQRRAGPRAAMPGFGTGLLLGAASFANYLAAFTALSFFVAQYNTRPDQFAPFHVGSGLLRLAKYAAASVAGGLPLYAPAGLANPVAAAIAIVLAGLALLVVLRWRRIGGVPSERALLAGCVIATPTGLLVLGLIFNNTPIELRYLSFAVPFAALLLSGALAERRWLALVPLALQAAAIAGLLFRPETMQPMRDAAREAAALADAQTVVLLPRGPDGVGIVGAFVTEAPDRLRLLLIDDKTDAGRLRGVAPHAALALLDRDADSHAALAALLAGFADDPCWRALPGGFNVTVFQSTCGDEPWLSSTASR
jgi:hypothetical protein